MRARWLALPPEPWKNGGGVTRTLAADPAGRWRVSIADIARDGPYSAFPGYDRVSVVLAGEGVALHGAGAAIALRPGACARFAGDAALQARLLGGPVRVLNLFVLRGAAQARVACLGEGGDACDAGSLMAVGAECRVARLAVAVAVDAGRFTGPSPGGACELAAGEYALWRVGDTPGVGTPGVDTPGVAAPSAWVPATARGFAVRLDIAVPA